ncbi:MAG TPA: GtrA family protein [Noviherbaspirillum sp.]
MKRLSGGLLAFGLVGAIGFAVDGGILTLLSQRFGVNIYLSRLFSFTTATLTTWILNRTLVFKVQQLDAEKKRREYGRYLLVQIGGALLNLGIFSAMINAAPALESLPVVPLAVGAVFGMLFNYSGSRYWVFKKA